jgi:hypothetical protein
MGHSASVTPAKAGVSASRAVTSRPEIPAFAGMTVENPDADG